ncbi:MAG: hypothetical protein H7Y11_09250, partial [Armatimonadetes bacterium]|nr:hypothetical protein [Anaerolineae bacterium]
DLSDWDAYALGRFGGGEAFALRNQTSVYAAVRSPLLASDYALLRFTFQINDGEYAVTLSPDQLRGAALREIRPLLRDRGELAVNAAFGIETVELRFPLAFIGAPIADVQLTSVALLDADSAIVSTLDFNVSLPFLPETDGVVYPEGRLGADATTFYVAGAVAQGATYWWANGRISTLNPEPGDSVTIELDVTLQTPKLPLTTADLQLGGALTLQPVGAVALDSNNGWSNVLTPSGLAIDNLRGDVGFGQRFTPWVNVTRLADTLVFGVQFSFTLPADLPPGGYVPTFTGLVQDADGRVTLWAENGILGEGDGSAPSLTRLPLVLNIGSVEEQRLHWALFYDHPSDGSRGLLPQAEIGAALSNRVRYNSASYILPPGLYPVEPYIPNLAPNSYTRMAAPLLPLLFPGGRLTASIERPDGVRDNLGSTSILQNRLSTDAADERTRFGAQSPVDLYRLTTLNPLYSAYNFDAYGAYTIALAGDVQDKFGNAYTGGGTYQVVIAELLDLTPGVLSGTPFEVGDVFYPGAHLAPGLPAEMTVTVRVYPLDGSEPITQMFSGTANAYGHYLPTAEESFTFATPGEYIVDYEARFTTSDGRLWAASLRSAGVIATPDSTLIAHGRRGAQNYRPELGEARPAWFNAQQYPATTPDLAVLRLYYPFYAGDLAFYADTRTSGVAPVLGVQALTEDYSAWLRGAIPSYSAADGIALDEPAGRDGLPLRFAGADENGIAPALLPDNVVNQAYAYLSAVRPGVTTRQLVLGDDTPVLDIYWDADDPLNTQIGAGLNGDRPTDYTWLFGGAVVRNAEAEVADTAIYAALGITGFTEGDGLGARVYPPYRGYDGGVLFTLNGVEYQAFFQPTGALPGQMMTLGESLSIAGQVAPTLRSAVTVTLTTPSGDVRQFSGVTNAIGYYYDPAQMLALDEVGVWTVEITTTTLAPSSVSSLEPPLPIGSVPGAVNRRFPIYVARENTEPLVWNRGGDLDSDTPSGAFFNFTLELPPGLTEVVAYRTVTMPGYILDDGEFPANSLTASYQYSPQALGDGFPALESNGRGNDAAASDVVTVTFVIIGKDSVGRTQVASRTFTFLHNRIVSFESES